MPPSNRENRQSGRRHSVSSLITVPTARRVGCAVTSRLEEETEVKQLDPKHTAAK